MREKERGKSSLKGYNIHKWGYREWMETKIVTEIGDICERKKWAEIGDRRRKLSVPSKHVEREIERLREKKGERD